MYCVRYGDEREGWSRAAEMAGHQGPVQNFT
jgi:hypothetical protein